MANGDQKAIAALFDDHIDGVVRVLRRLGVRESDLEDVAQDVFLVAHRGLAGFEGRSTHRAWLYGICRKRAAAYRRRAHRHREIPVSHLPVQTVDASQPADLARKRDLAVLQGLLEELPDRLREVYVLYEIEELAMGEVADAVGCLPKTAYARLAKARKTLRAALRRRGRSVA